ncbi:uncharacterized protein RCO7_00910 [Rhynchosporium graminicola]|uniref:Zn(2)-C6 fungal-type domain-containing protein n=1 Tax=Rhynchosporium graminicola TaxID=2792576 RepID=A0A1E1JQB4_9HELO|nr:uncharacterized protein RCO7_00910 [Rhynchosporium commune]
MYSSNASIRPRQRTFTSCTECRRRKQRCNQAKDRPCNNCARRYPPVICEYGGSSSPPPSSRNVDVLDSPLKAQDTTRGNDVSSTAYIQTTQSTLGDIPIASTSDSNHNTIPYNTSNTDHRQYQDGAPASNTPYIATPVSYTADSGFYQDQTDYSVSGSPQGSHSGYYPIAGQQRNDWLATTGNSSTFLGAISEYYYIEPTPENQVYQRR